MPKKLSDRAVVASVVAAVCHVCDGRDGICDVETPQMSCPAVAETARVTDTVRQFVKSFDLVEKVDSICLFLNPLLLMTGWLGTK